MGTGKSLNYQLSIHPQLISDDLNNPNLPAVLKIDFEQYKLLFKIDPFRWNKLEFQKIGFDEPKGLSFKSLDGDLSGCFALKIEWDNNENFFRLVYKVTQKKNTKTVFLISFDRHNDAYDSAIERERNQRRKSSKKLKPRQKRRPSY